MDITNNAGAPITINRIFAHWVKLQPSQKIERLLLNGIVIWNTSDPDSPSDIPTEGNWVGGADLTIPDATVRPVTTFLIQFPNDLEPTGYRVHIVFNIDCQVIGTK
jgi:hypothetical protein